MKFPMQLAALVLVTVLVAVMRTVGFEYFHGDPLPAQGLRQAARVIGIS